MVTFLFCHVNNCLKNQTQLSFVNNSSIFQIYDNNTECNIPKKFARKNYTKTLAKCHKMRYNILASYGGIAQLVRALASHARGRRFESYCLYHFGGFAF